MALIISKYENEVDKCWYTSSNIFYSECIDHKDSYKDLKITFKDGRTYIYKNVTVQDYLLFKNGGLSGDSQGKALNRYILARVGVKNKYDFEKLDKMDINALEEEKKLIIEERENEKKLLLEQQKEEDGQENG